MNEWITDKINAGVFIVHFSHWGGGGGGDYFFFHCTHRFFRVYNKQRCNLRLRLLAIFSLSPNFFNWIFFPNIACIVSYRTHIQIFLDPTIIDTQYLRLISIPSQQIVLKVTGFLFVVPLWPFLYCPRYIYILFNMFLPFYIFYSHIYARFRL